MSTAVKALRRQIRLEALAYAMRHTPSEPERVLWRSLRCSQLGVRFRRQVVLHGFIADFFAPSARLIVEVDGPHHEKRQRQRMDTRRDAALAVQGLRVLRLPALLVLREMPTALRVVTDALTR